MSDINLKRRIINLSFQLSHQKRTPFCHLLHTQYIKHSLKVFNNALGV